MTTRLGLPRLGLHAQRSRRDVRRLYRHDRKAKKSDALKAKRLTKDETRKGGKELYTPAALERWVDGLADA